MCTYIKKNKTNPETNQCWINKIHGNGDKSDNSRYRWSADMSDVHLRTRNNNVTCWPNSSREHLFFCKFLLLKVNWYILWLLTPITPHLGLTIWIPFLHTSIINQHSSISDLLRYSTAKTCLNSEKIAMSLNDYANER